MPTSNFTPIVVGGPCKINDNGNVIYFEDDVLLTPKPTYRAIPSAVGGEHDSTLVDLVWEITGRPSAVWNATYQSTLLPSAFTNWSVANGLMCGFANRPVTVLGSDSNGFTFTRACLTKMPELFLGLGKSLYGEVTWTAFLGQGKQLTDNDAFYQTNATAWTQADYPTTHWENECTATWGALGDWSNVFAEEGFTLTHELGTTPVKQGNITIDFKINKYRAMMGFKPQEPTVADTLTAFALQGASAGIGTRLSANANDFVVTGPNLSVTVKSAAVNKGQFAFSNKLNRIGEFGMISSLAVPGTRLVLV